MQCSCELALRAKLSRQQHVCSLDTCTLQAGRHTCECRRISTASAPARSSSACALPCAATCIQTGDPNKARQDIEAGQPGWTARRLQLWRVRQRQACRASQARVGRG
jgi:hypothetical protein